MQGFVKLGDYDSVVANKARVQTVFSLPEDDPRYMPVTRDLSPAKRQMILNWLVTTGNAGKPNLGTPPAAPLQAAIMAAVAPGGAAGEVAMVGGKTAAAQRARPGSGQLRPFVSRPL